MSWRISFFKDRQKFSAAHFTLFPDGTAERLHGHNYAVEVSLEGERLAGGLLVPFHDVKEIVTALAAEWDERVLLPAAAPDVSIEVGEEQVEVRLVTPRCRKFYSFPREDVVLLECDNVSSENLARLFLDRLAERLADTTAGLTGLEVSISETAGQKVTYR